MAVPGLLFLYKRYLMSKIYRCALPLVLVAVAFLAAACSSAVCAVRGCYVVAHRGGASLAPENSLSAIEKSIGLGVDAVEIDVRLSADGAVVVFHDKRVDRKSNGSGLVRELTLEELKLLRLSGSDGQLTDERMPTLDEVLSCVVGRCNVLIEVKDDDARGIERAVVDAVRRHDAEGWVAVQAFSDAVLWRFVELGVSFPLEKLLVFKYPLVPYIYDGSSHRFSIDDYAHVSSFNIKKRYARKGLVERFRSAGKDVKVWTLKKNDTSCPQGVTGVITDCPQLFRP